MKITKKQLREIIKEEKSTILAEDEDVIAQIQQYIADNPIPRTPEGMSLPTFVHQLEAGVFGLVPMEFEALRGAYDKLRRILDPDDNSHLYEKKKSARIEVDISKKYLKKIIKEELSRLFKEEDESQGQGGQGGYPRPQSQGSQDTEEEKRARKEDELDMWDTYPDVVDMWAATIGSAIDLGGYDKLMPFLEMLTGGFENEITNHYASLSMKPWRDIRSIVAKYGHQLGKTRGEIIRTIPPKGTIESFQSRKKKLSEMGYNDELSYAAFLEAIDEVVDFG